MERSYGLWKGNVVYEELIQFMESQWGLWNVLKNYNGLYKNLVLNTVKQHLKKKIPRI